MAEHFCDLAILGAGCAGLSLATELAARAPHLKVMLFDSRSQYEDDRTWCFWTAGNSKAESLIEKRWKRWSFADAENRAILHEGSTYQYACIRSGRFYAHARECVAAANFGLHLDAPVRDVQPSADGIRIQAGSHQVTAAQVVDTRPQAARAKLYQLFAGVEIETGHAAFDADEAGLMEGMTADGEGFRFIYTLPFSARHALIEITRFAPSPVQPASLDGELAAFLATRGLQQARIIRREHGLLPMGVAELHRPADPRIVAAGIAGGALRAATGYAFLRIQAWAQECAASIARGGPALPHPHEPAFRNWLDAVFLTALRRNPHDGPRYFLKIAKALKPDAFARFMTDAASPADLARLITALPPLPFLAAAARVASPFAQRGEPCGAR
jgi:lycopene beta-cyclase